MCVLEVRLLVDIEIDVDRIERNQSGQGFDLPGATLNQITFRYLRSTHSTRNRGRYARELQVQLPAAQRRLSGRDASFGFAANGGAPVVLFGSHSVVVVQRLGSLEVALRSRALRVRLREFSLQPIHF